MDPNDISFRASIGCTINTWLAASRPRDPKIGEPTLTPKGSPRSVQFGNLEIHWLAAAPWHAGGAPHWAVGSTGRLFQGQQQHARTLGLVLESPAGVTGSQWQQSCSEVLGQPRVGFVDVLCFWLLSVSKLLLSELFTGTVEKQPARTNCQQLQVDSLLTPPFVHADLCNSTLWHWRKNSLLMQNGKKEIAGWTRSQRGKSFWPSTKITQIDPDSGYWWLLHCSLVPHLSTRWRLHTPPCSVACATWLIIKHNWAEEGIQDRPTARTAIHAGSRHFEDVWRDSTEAIYDDIAYQNLKGNLEVVPEMCQLWQHPAWNSFRALEIWAMWADETISPKLAEPLHQEALRITNNARAWHAASRPFFSDPPTAQNKWSWRWGLLTSRSRLQRRNTPRSLKNILRI
jgi:hypothetical protein